MKLTRDCKVIFPAYLVHAKTKRDKRQFIGELGLRWIRLQRQRLRPGTGTVMFDIDDTLIDNTEKVADGFEFMVKTFVEASKLFVVYLVTARPEDTRTGVINLLYKLEIHIPPDRLFMLPTELYSRDTSYVEKFKWDVFLKISAAHCGVVARFGDQVWDIAHINFIEGEESEHIDHKDCYFFMDYALGGTISFKTPG